MIAVPMAEKIRQTMVKQGIPEDIIARLAFPDPDLKGQARVEALLALIRRMDELLTREQRLRVMEQQGCCTTGKPAAAHRAFGRKHAGKSVAERIALFDELDTPHRPPCRLNPDGTLTVSWGFERDGACQCVCGDIKKLPPPVHVSPTFCGCCGGHARQNLQRSLGVGLRLKEIVSSAASSGGQKHCEFTFEIVP